MKAAVLALLACSALAAVAAQPELDQRAPAGRHVPALIVGWAEVQSALPARSQTLAAPPRQEPPVTGAGGARPAAPAAATR